MGNLFRHGGFIWLILLSSGSSCLWAQTQYFKGTLRVIEVCGKNGQEVGMSFPTELAIENEEYFYGKALM